VSSVVVTAHTFFQQEQSAVVTVVWMSAVLFDPSVALAATDLQILQHHAVNVTVEFSAFAPFLNGHGPGTTFHRWHPFSIMYSHFPVRLQNAHPPLCTSQLRTMR